MKVWGVMEGGKIAFFAPNKHSALEKAVVYETAKPHYRSWLGFRNMKDCPKSKLDYFDAVCDDVEFVTVTVSLRDIKPLICIGLEATQDDIQAVIDAELHKDEGE
jgi:hypothetical protein